MVEWVKQHPYLAGGLVLGIIILVVIIRNSSASSTQAAQTTSSTSGVDDTQAVAALNANAQVQALAYQAQTQVASQNAALNAVALQTAAAQSVANNQTAGAVQVGLAQTNNQVAIASIAAGGITPFSVNGTGPTPPPAQVVGISQVQAQNAQQGAAQNAQIAQTSNLVAGAVLNPATGAAIAGQQSVTGPQSSAFVPNPIDYANANFSTQCGYGDSACAAQRANTEVYLAQNSTAHNAGISNQSLAEDAVTHPGEFAMPTAGYQLPTSDPFAAQFNAMVG